jgi:hypothetical protein
MRLRALTGVLSAVLLALLCRCSTTANPAAEARFDTPTRVYVHSTFPGLQAELGLAVRRELSAHPAGKLELVASREEADVIATCTLEAAICLDCNRQPAPEGYSITVVRGGTTVAEWHRFNIGCVSWECLTKRAARDLVPAARAPTHRQTLRVRPRGRGSSVW